jgi:hypothetical protein
MLLALVFFKAMNDCVKCDILHIFWMILYAHYIVKLCHIVTLMSMICVYGLT